MNFAYKNNLIYITLFYFFYLFFFSKGTIAGDYERIYNITITFLESDRTYFEFINGNEINKINQSINEQSFFKHNFIFFLIFIIIIKIQSLFSFIIESEYLSEFILASIPGSLFLFSIILLFQSNKNIIDKNLHIAGIIFFFIGSYIINFFASSAYAESVIFFLLSLRIFLKNKKSHSIFIPIIDFLLIKIRITNIFIMPYFLFSFFSKKINIKLFVKYFLTFVFMYFFTEKIYPSSNLSTRYFDTIFSSFCVADLNNLFLNFYENILIYLKRVFLTFFSLNLGLVFTFPCFILIIISFFYKFNKLDFLKMVGFFSIILALALEEFWFLPAGISGNRGLAPFLILFFSNYIIGFKIFLNYFKNKSFYIIVFFILMFYPSLFYRSTIGTYAVCGSIENCQNSIRGNDLSTRKILNISNEKKLVCRTKNNFAMFKPEMHPSIYSLRIIYNKLMNIKKSAIYYDKDELLIDTAHIIPETIGAKFLFLVNNKNLNLINKSKEKFQLILQGHKLILNILINLMNIIMLIIFILVLKLCIKNYHKNI